jgi:hypothetical protein
MMTDMKMACLHRFLSAVSPVILQMICGMHMTATGYVLRFPILFQDGASVRFSASGESDFCHFHFS